MAAILSANSAGWLVSAYPGATALHGLAIDPGARTRVAVQQIGEVVAKTREDAGEAEKLVRDGVAFAPADARLYSVLGTLAQLDAREEEAARLYATALALSPAEQNANLQLAASEAKAQRFGPALGHVDVLLTRWPSQLANAQPVVLAALADAEGTRALVAALGRNRPWRFPLISRLAGARDTAPAAAQLVSAMAAHGAPPTFEEQRSAMNGLLWAQRTVEAYQLFLASLTDEERPLAGFVFDGAFTRRPRARPFDWRANPSPGVEVSFPGGDVGATIRFGDAPVTFFDFQQTLALAPGRYKVSVETSGERLAAPRNINLVLRCGVSLRLLTMAPLPLGDCRRAATEREAVVPAEGCDSQEVAIASGLTAPSWALRLSGTLIVHSIAIELADR